MNPPPSPIQISNFRNDTFIKVGSIDSSTLKKKIPLLTQILRSLGEE